MTDRHEDILFMSEHSSFLRIEKGTTIQINRHLWQVTSAFDNVGSSDGVASSDVNVGLITDGEGLFCNVTGFVKGIGTFAW